MSSSIHVDQCPLLIAIVISRNVHNTHIHAVHTSDENVGAGKMGQWLTLPSLGPGQLRILVTFSSPTATNSTGYTQHSHTDQRAHTEHIHVIH